MSNKIRPFVSTIQNNRDHRKICVIDGQRYVGGVNLADEYINEKERFGHWKDTAIRIERRCRAEPDNDIPADVGCRYAAGA